MTDFIAGLEALFAAIPLPFLEAWGRVAYFVGIPLALFAFGGFTFRPGGRWALGRERQSWDAKAFLSIPLTFAFIFISGFIGSFIILVPGAQTFESLKDLLVFLCVVLFGYPALITVPFAYALSDLIEGVPMEFLLDWLPGYFINPACFWIAYQIFGKNPDFRRIQTWGKYLVFVALFLALEPVLWGFICAGKFTPELSYRTITPALFFTTGITWIIAPFAMLGALPLARRMGMFWAEIAGHVQERVVGHKDWVWGASQEPARRPVESTGTGIPIRIFILIPLAAFVLFAVGATAYVTLRSTQDDAHRLAVRLQEQATENIKLQLDAYLERTPGTIDGARTREIGELLRSVLISAQGRTFIVDRSGRVITSSTTEESDPIVASAVAGLQESPGGLENLGSGKPFRFDHITAKPLSRESWLARAGSYEDRRGRVFDWVLVTVIPEGFYLAGVQQGNSRSAAVFSAGLLLALGIAALLATLVTTPLQRIAGATRALAAGDLNERVPVSALQELSALGRSFNDMAEQLKQSFAMLRSEVDVRTRRERELAESEARLRSSENRVHLAIRAAKLSIWDWDVERDLLTWDDSMYQLYGVRKEDFTGAYEAWSKCLIPEDFVRATGDVEAALRGERDFSSEFRVRHEGGEMRIIRGVAETIRGEDGRALRMVGINWDVTEELLAKQELRQHRDHLEELVAERTAALSVAVGQAEAANRAKSTFLANMSHEIRTPMNAMLGFAQLLQRSTALGPTERDHIDTILRSGEHLLGLINDVLEMSKIEVGRTTLQPSSFDLHAMVQDLVTMFRHSAVSKNLHFEVEGLDRAPRYVTLDVGKLRQILINMLGNAVKFTSEGGVALEIEAPLSADGAGRLLVAVRDTGHGIAPDELSQVFMAFEQTQSGLAARTGTGLGMPLSQEFARLMGGDLTVTSEVGVGSAFLLDVPMMPASVADVEVSEPVRRVMRLAAGQQCRVLVADDSPDNRALLSSLLTNAGFEVREAENGQRAVELWESWQPDAIMMDIRMPVMDGYEATRRIKMTEQGRATKIIAVTASVLDQEFDDLDEAGMDAWLWKPFRADALFAKLGVLTGVAYEYGDEDRENTQWKGSVALRADQDSLTGQTTPATGGDHNESSALPQDLWNVLRNAADRLDEDEFRRVIGRVAEYDGALAVQLAALVDRYDYDAIHATLASVHDDGGQTS